MSDYNYPTEIIDLPSKGLTYPKDHPLKSGKVELKYMTAKEEDILSNSNFIDNNTVLDKLLESVTFNKFPIKDILPGDKNAILIATRILGLGNIYKFDYKGKPVEVDLSKIDNKPFDESIISPTGTSKFKLPTNGTEIEFKFLTELELDEVEEEVLSIEKVTGNLNTVSIGLKHALVSIDGDTDRNNIKNFSEHIISRDSRALRKHIRDIEPNTNFTFITPDKEEVVIPITISFLWPELGE